MSKHNELRELLEAVRRVTRLCDKIAAAQIELHQTICPGEKVARPAPAYTQGRVVYIVPTPPGNTQWRRHKCPCCDGSGGRTGDVVWMCGHCSGAGWYLRAE